MVEHLYRFRPVERLLEKDELRNQEIYFASPDQLNDPMEGFRDVFWQGDEIVWKNFFRHFVICLDNAFSQWMICAEAEPLEWKHIPIFNHGDINDGIPHKEVEQEILAALFAEPSIQRLITALASHPFPVRRDELAAHLRAIHIFVLNLIRDAYTRRGLHPDVPNADALKNSARKSIDLTLESIDKFREAAKQHPISEYQVDAFYIARQRTVAQLDFINFYNNRVDFSQANRNFVVLTFPDEFVKQVETLVYPEWYAACFMTDCRNSAIWGSYGENHTAVCLKFRATNVAHQPGLNLRRQVGLNADGPIVDFFPHDFKKIFYENEHQPVDFFRSLGRFPIPVLRRHWYSDEHGNHSPCGDEIFRADEAWRKRYWETFYHAITRKLTAWNSEDEYRLILDDYFLDFRDSANRKLTYRFADLDGIIFGIKTPMKAKLDICKIVEEKCRADERTDFKFYQAFYSRQTGTIEHAEIGLLKFQF
jgi:hypothetical protein